MRAENYDVEIIDLDADELGEFDALAVCRLEPPSAGSADDEAEVEVEEDDGEESEEA